MTQFSLPTTGTGWRWFASTGWVSLLTLYLWSSGFMFNVSIPFTQSGVFALYGSDLLALPVLALISYMLFRMRRSLSRDLKMFAAIYVAFFTYCAAVFAFRTANGASDLASLLIPRVNLASSLILILILLIRISKRELVIVAYVFSTTVAVAAVPLALLDVRLFGIHLPSNVFENLAVRTDIQLFFIPILLYGVLRRESLRLGAAAIWLFALNLGSLVLCSAVTGARVNAILVPMVVLLATIATLFATTGPRLRVLGASVVLPVVAAVAVLLAIAPHNPKVEYGLERSDLYSMVADQFEKLPAPTQAPDRDDSEGTSTEPGQPLEKFEEPTPVPAMGGSEGASTQPGRVPTPEESKAASASVRLEVWAMAWGEFKNNVWFGTGLKQYEVERDLATKEYTATIQPHNFMLSYLTSYGVIGFLLWLLLILYWPVLIVWRARARDRIGMLTLGTSLATIFGASFFQPLMLNPQVLLPVYFILGTIAKVSSLDDAQPLADASASTSDGDTRGKEGAVAR